MCVSSATLLTAFLYLARPASAGLFLARLPEAELKSALLVEIEAALNSNLHDVTKHRLGEIEEALRPTFDTLPKSEDGRLGHEGVRYILNRLFAQQHGWFINGLQPGSDSWNTSASTGKLIMRDHLPEVLQELFELRVGGHGSTIRDVVALAAMVEHLIRDELRGKLETVYQANGILLESRVSAAQAVHLMELYMICFLRGHDASNYDTVSISRLKQKFHQQYKGWQGVREIIAEVRQDIALDSSELTFDDLSSMLEAVIDRFAPFYENQCNEVKSSLLDIEDRRSGRVRLIDFYKAAVHNGVYQFSESIAAMRQYGMLDEVDPSNPRVLIANYVGGQSNCIARTSFYSTCCPNKCEELLNRVERALGTYEATPAEIIAAFEDPEAAFEPGFESLSPWLRGRLADLAQHHGGRIPLHGRLFTQWMHFVHPRDCMYPHLSASTPKKTIKEWSKEIGQRVVHTMSELSDLTHHLSSIGADGQAATPAGIVEDYQDAASMWTMEEELFIGCPVEGGHPDKAPTEPSLALAAVAMCGTVLVVLFAVSSWLLRSSKTTGGWTPVGASLAKLV